jgi:protein-tyrosine phosphatase
MTRVQTAVFRASSSHERRITVSDLAPRFNVSRVTERLLVGGGLTGPDEVAYLKSQGVTHVISAAAELSDASLLTESGIAFMQVPWLDDGQQKDVGDFRNALAFVLSADALAAQNGSLPVFMTHCAAGVNRGPMLASFLLGALAGYNADHAFALVQAARPVAGAFSQPNYRTSVQRALDAVLPAYVRADLDVPAEASCSGSCGGIGSC